MAYRGCAALLTFIGAGFGSDDELTLLLEVLKHES